MSEKLKPCSHCGVTNNHIFEVKSVSGTTLYQPKCFAHHCQATMKAYPTEQAAIEAWNKRSLSDGYHTMEELYRHRYLLFIALCLNRPQSSWIGEEGHYDGYFCLYTRLHQEDRKVDVKQISYHIPDEYKHLVEPTIKVKPNNYDGHTSNDVLDRLIAYCDRDF